MKTISKKINKNVILGCNRPQSFLGFHIGIYLNLFNTKMWLNSLNVVNKENLNGLGVVKL